jgi:hypothetical protein
LYLGLDLMQIVLADKINGNDWCNDC